MHLAKTGNITCPFTIISRYINVGGLDLSSTNRLFCNLKSTNGYSLGNRGLSHSRAREVLLNTLEVLGYPKSKFGLHSLRAGGASAAANAGVNDRLFKRHGRWKSE